MAQSELLELLKMLRKLCEVSKVAFHSDSGELVTLQLSGVLQNLCIHPAKEVQLQLISFVCR